MKKSQVLAALALAFALGLGVVAPVANTYAAITPNTATTKQKAEIYDQAKDLLADANNLEDYAEYKELYNSFEGDGGLIKALQDAAKAQLRVFNLNLTSEQYVNVYINRFNDILTRRASEIKNADISNKDHAQFQTIPAFTTAATLEAAYNSIENVMDIVNADLDIMRKNYDYQANNVIGEINDQLAAIVSTLENRSDNLIAGLNTALAAVDSKFGVTTSTLTRFTSLINEIDEAAYDALITNTEWVGGTPANDIEVAQNLGLIIKTAKALPKYNLAGEVAKAEAKVANIPANSGIDVDYANAKNYIAALTSAITAYRNGTTTTPSVTTTTIVSADGNVSVTGKFEAGKVFVKATKSNKEVKAFDGKKSYIYDIVLTDVNGNEVTPTGEVTVTVKVQGDINGAKSNIYHVDENGKVQLVKSSYKDGVMTFTTSHFSLYAIVEDNGTNLTTPDTGALFGTEGSASTTVAMVAGIATALTAAGAGVVAYRNARRSSRK